MKLTIKKETVVKLFTALGFKTATSWDEKRLQAKIKKLPELVDGVKIRNPKTRAVLKKIMAANKVVFKEEPERASEAAMRKTDDGKKKATKASDNKAGNKKKATKTKAKKPVKKALEEQKDAFGRRLGTQGAKIDEHLSKKPKTIATIAKETKMSTGRISNHMRDLVSKGFVKKNKEGEYFVK